MRNLRILVVLTGLLLTTEAHAQACTAGQFLQTPTCTLTGSLSLKKAVLDVRSATQTGFFAPIIAPGFSSTVPAGSVAYQSLSGALWQPNNPVDGEYVAISAAADDNQLRVVGSANATVLVVASQNSNGVVALAVNNTPTANLQLGSTGAGAVQLDSDGLFTLSGTTTAIHVPEIDYVGKCDSTASPGNATCNAAAGRAAVAAGQTAVTITNSLVSATSIVLVTPQTIDATCLYPRAAVPGVGSFVFTMGPAACTAAVNFTWVVHN